MNDLLLEEKPKEAASSEKLNKILDLISIDDATGDLVVCNGKSRLVLKKDGGVRIEGERIIQVAQEDISLNGAVIDLN